MLRENLTKDKNYETLMRDIKKEFSKVAFIKSKKRNNPM